MILVLDFGGQYNQLIARRVRENHVYCEVHPQSLSLEKIREMAPKGIILTGGPNSVYTEDAVTCSPEIFELGIPVARSRRRRRANTVRRKSRSMRRARHRSSLQACARRASAG